MRVTEQPREEVLEAGLESINQVMAELDQLKIQSERLDLINRLHKRMAGVLSMTGMIEAYSVWLMPIVEHELIGYSNAARNKKHLFCSGHGPSRRKAIAFAEQLISKNDQSTIVENSEGHFGHKWIFETVEDTGILLILKEGRELTERELQVINDSLIVLAESLQRGLEYEDLFERASSDSLTGLSNRRVFDERIQGMMDSATRYDNPLSMLSMDLDRFKEINDNLGHQVGDQVLIAVANVLSDEVRSTDLLVRMGGDEFLLVLDNTNRNSARILAERLVRKIDELDVWADENVKLGVSIGLTQLEKKESLKSWMERTDDILYHAKAEGRARVAVS
ncbi:MAG: GGDEF domain-containing protein [Desulfobulbaceae bacterium]|nr:MAG: GGDEF domain-containing protein [Desulfobulbaceae bacterium]